MKLDNVAYKLADESLTSGNVTVELSGAQEVIDRSSRPREAAPESRDSRMPQDVVSVSPVWQDVASRIDPRNASPLEIIELSRTLYGAGVITFEDHVTLSFQPEVNADEGGSTASSEKKDFIALWEGKQDEALRQGASRAELEDLHRIQAVLGYIDSIR
ncbi:hypothetical protein [Emcibacter sp.]|uniref:hypothetical protein n=1 Tax=Emcibacter sp. TaxID=1979954 RepID=UPI003A8DBEF8